MVVRSDDQPDVVRDRLKLYHRETEPLVEYYGARGIVKKVDGSGSIKGVTAAVLQSLGRGQG